MFWGLIMEANKRYTQVVEKSFHVSMASLDLLTADDNLVQVMLCYDNRKYLLCSLNKNSTWQVPLDLNFQEGTKIAFTCNGHGHVHLTGYVIPDEDMDFDELEDEEEEEVPQLVDKKLKRKAIGTLKSDKNTKRPKQEIKAESSDDEEIDLDDSESDDSESEDQEWSTKMDEEEDSDESEEDDEEKEVEQQKRDKKKDKKNKQKKKQETNELLNGKDNKQEQQSKQQKKNKKQAPAQQQQQQQKQQQQQQQQQQINGQNAQKKRIVEGGVQVEELQIGNGSPAKTGKFVSVYYVGRLKNGKKFDSTTQGDGFKFRLGRGEVIKGWDVGIAGMKAGGKRRITIPPAMAYGAKGSPPVIPGNSTLVFEVELRNVH